MIPHKSLELYKVNQDIGFGIRATRKITQGECLGTYAGELLTKAAHRKRYPDPKDDIFSLQIDDSDWFIDASRGGNWSRFVNCAWPNRSDANLEYQTDDNFPLEVFLVAIRDIYPGDQLLTNYNREGEIPENFIPVKMQVNE